jgi:NADPH:quinone reductase-like Zn-dependent oxidoreductase
VDAVFDTVGGDTLRRSLSVLNSDGRLVTLRPSEEDSQDQRTREAFFIVEPRRLAPGPSSIRVVGLYG